MGFYFYPRSGFRTENSAPRTDYKQSRVPWQGAWITNLTCLLHWSKATCHPSSAALIFLLPLILSMALTTCHSHCSFSFLWCLCSQHFLCGLCGTAPKGHGKPGHAGCTERALSPFLDTYESFAHSTGSRTGPLTYSQSALAPIPKTSARGTPITVTRIAPLFQDGPMRWCSPGSLVVMATVETQKGAILQPAHTETLSAETPMLLDKLLSTPELQDQVEAFFSLDPQEEEPPGLAESPLSQEESQALLDML